MGALCFTLLILLFPLLLFPQQMSNKSSYALVNLVPESRRLLTGVSPVTARKAIKNEVEIAGMRRAHVSDTKLFLVFVS